jgi:hypothetical protein
LQLALFLPFCIDWLQVVSSPRYVVTKITYLGEETSNVFLLHTKEYILVSWPAWALRSGLEIGIDQVPNTWAVVRHLMPFKNDSKA